MTHYSPRPGYVRADIFRPHLKWYETCMLDMSEFYDTPHVIDAVQIAWHRQYQNDEAGMYLVVLQPYHKNAHPVMAVIEEWPDEGVYPPPDWNA